MQHSSISEYKTRKKFIPIFLDFSGTIDNLIEPGAENVKSFFDSIKEMQSKFKCDIQITIVTGIDTEFALSNLITLHNLAKNYGLPHLFTGAVAEYCGFRITGLKKDDIRAIYPTNHIDQSLWNSIQQKITELGGSVFPSVKSYLNITFPKESTISIKDIKKVLKCFIGENYIILSYVDKHGKQFDVKAKDHTKAEAVKLMLEEFLQRGDEIPCVICGGDSKPEDFGMYYNNKKYLDAQNIPNYFIALADMEEIPTTDPNVFVASRVNSLGIEEGINYFISKAVERDTGGITIGE